MREDVRFAVPLFTICEAVRYLGARRCHGFASAPGIGSQTPRWVSR